MEPLSWDAGERQAGSALSLLCLSGRACVEGGWPWARVAGRIGDEESSQQPCAVITPR